MAPKKKNEDSSLSVLNAAREAISNKRPRDAISIIKSASLQYDAELVYVLASAYRDLLRPLRRSPRTFSAPAGTQASVDELQRFHDLHTELHLHARDAALCFEEILKRENLHGDAILLLQLEIADFKRYMVEALDALRIPADEVRKEVITLYCKIQESITDSTASYIPLRLAINMRIFDKSEDAAAFIIEIASKNLPSPKARKPDALEDREPVIAAWPVPSEEVARLKMKVVALANYCLSRCSIRMAKFEYHH